MKIAVIGGTGRIGSKIVETLAKDGHEALPHARSTGVDLLTREGLGAALKGADVVIDATQSPTADDASADFFQAAAASLLAEAQAAGVQHAVLLSIVGVDRVPDLGYYRAKVIQEELFKAGGVPFSIVRAGQFFEYIGDIMSWTAQGDTVRLPPTLLQPIAAADAARAVADIAVGAPPPWRPRHRRSRRAAPGRTRQAHPHRPWRRPHHRHRPRCRPFRRRVRQRSPCGRRRAHRPHALSRLAHHLTEANGGQEMTQPFAPEHQHSVTAGGQMTPHQVAAGGVVFGVLPDTFTCPSHSAYCRSASRPRWNAAETWTLTGTTPARGALSGLCRRLHDGSWGGGAVGGGPNLSMDQQMQAGPGDGEATSRDCRQAQDAFVCRFGRQLVITGP